jgi:hypothetical protein
VYLFARSVNDGDQRMRAVVKLLAGAYTRPLLSSTQALFVGYFGYLQYIHGSRLVTTWTQDGSLTKTA